MTRLVSLAVVTLLIIFFGITFYQVVAPFLMPLFLAAVIAMLAQPIQEYFLKKTKGHTQLSAGLTTGSVLVGISVPVMMVVLIATFQVVLFVGDMLQDKNWDEISQTIRTELDIDRVTHDLHPYASALMDDLSEPELKTRLLHLRGTIKDSIQNGLELLVENTMGVANKAMGLMGSLASLTVSLLMFIIALFYFLADGPALVATSERLIPIGVEYQRQLRMRFYNVVRAVVTATFLAALAQGLATATMLCTYFGFRQFMILFLIATFASMVPLFGTWLVWGPCAIFLALTGHWVPAILFLLIGSTLIGWLDNLIRTYVLQSDAQLHPLLAFVSVLGGVQVMGLWGVFFAPIVAAILHALVVIFNTEVSELSAEHFGRKPTLNPNAGPVEKPTEGDSAESDTAKPAAGTQPTLPTSSNDKPPSEENGGD